MAEIDDVFFPDAAGPAFVRQWDIVDGYPQCPRDAVIGTDATATAALQKNDAVRRTIAAVEAYEAAPDDSAPAATKALALWRTGEPAADAPEHAAWAQAKADALAALATEAAKPLANDPRPVPASVTLFQGRTVMRQMPGQNGGTLFDAVDAYVEANKSTNHALYDAWNFSNGFDRHGALVQALAPAFGITDAQLDTMFRMGATIRG